MTAAACCATNAQTRASGNDLASKWTISADGRSVDDRDVVDFLSTTIVTCDTPDMAATEPGSRFQGRLQRPEHQATLLTSSCDRIGTEDSRDVPDDGEVVRKSVPEGRRQLRILECRMNVRTLCE